MTTAHQPVALTMPLAEQRTMVEEFLADRRRLADAGSVTAAREVEMAERDLRAIEAADLMTPVDEMVGLLRSSVDIGAYGHQRDVMFSLAVAAVRAYIDLGGTGLGCTLQAIAENLE